MKKTTVILIFVLFLLAPLKLWAKAPKLIHHFGSDVAELFTSWPLLVLASGGALAGGLTQVDSQVKNSLNPSHHRETLNSILDITGSPYVVDGVAGITFLTGYVFHNSKLINTSEVILESLFLTEASTLSIKFAVNRARPNGGKYSFPSGHAARTFAIATVLETLHGPAIGIPSYLIAGFISYSRLDSNAHHVSDAVFGSALGASVGWATARFHKRTGDVLISPLVGKEQTGLMVSGLF